MVWEIILKCFKFFLIKILQIMKNEKCITEHWFNVSLTLQEYLIKKFYWKVNKKN
jgi:hypothetical protein